MLLPLHHHETHDRYFLCLGAGTNQLPLIRAAREMGHRVIAVDRDTLAPGFAHADLRIQCSILKPGKIRRTLLENMIDGRISGVTCRSPGGANLSAALISRHFGTPALSMRALRFFRNKRAMKESLRELGILMPKSHAWNSIREKWNLLDAPLPLIARPARSHGKLGIQLLKTREDLRRFLRRNPTDTGSFLVEEFIAGDEVTVLGLVYEGRYRPVCISDKIVSRTPPLFAEIAHRHPSKISRPVELEINQAMQRIVSAAGLESGPVVAEFIVNNRNEPHLVECVPEAGGEHIADVIAPAGSGLDYFQEMVRLSSRDLLHIEPEVCPDRTGKAVYIRYILQREGRFRNLAFPERLRRHPGLVFARALKESGERTSLEKGNLDRIAVFALEGPLHDVRNLEREAEQFAKETKIEYDRGVERALPERKITTLLSR